MTSAPRHTWFMIVRQARNLMREPIWIALLLVQPMVWLCSTASSSRDVDAARRLRHDVVHRRSSRPAIVVMNAFFGAHLERAWR